MRGIVFEGRFFSLKKGCEVWDQAELPTCSGDDEVGGNSRASRLGLMRVYAVARIEGCVCGGGSVGRSDKGLSGI